MSSRFRNSLAALALAALFAGCDREARDSRGKPLGETVPASAGPDTILPGGAAPAPLDPRAAAYEGNAFAIAQGQQLYLWMNCVGCHAHGGGGMGPALMDDEWIYGSDPQQIFSSIAQGRPNGMPAWGSVLSNDQIWRLVGYVQSMGGQLRKDVAPTRNDDMFTGPSEQRAKKQKPRNASPPPAH